MLQKKLQAKNNSMIDKILEDNDKKEVSMASMSFGGRSTLSNSGISSVQVESSSGPTRSSSGCPVNHSKSSTDTQPELVQENQISHDVVINMSVEQESRKSSQPFRENVQDDLPEIQVSAFEDRIDHMNFLLLSIIYRITCS